MQTNFKVSYIVHLITGGPDLKIVGFQGEKVTVEWRSESGSLQQPIFPMICFH